MNPASIWPIVFGIASVTSIVLAFVYKVKTSRSVISDVGEINKDIKTIYGKLGGNALEMEKLHSAIALTKKEIEFSRETQGRMEITIKTLDDAIQEITLELPKIKTCLTTKINENDKALSKKIESVFSKRFGELQALISGKKEEG
jgi:uncharacterized protein YoxC